MFISYSDSSPSRPKMLPKNVEDELKSKHIVLASSSKNKADLLKRLNLNIEACPSKFEENLDPSDYSPSNFVVETALGKVLEVDRRLLQTGIKPDVIIGADTMVELNGKLFGKPKSLEEAFDIITKLTSSGCPNIVHTGVVIKYREILFNFVESTKVYMQRLTPEEISEYVKREETRKYAGGYAIQGIAGTFIDRIEGDYNNVTGLPLSRLRRELINIFKTNGNKQ